MTQALDTLNKQSWSGDQLLAYMIYNDKSTTIDYMLKEREYIGKKEVSWKKGWR